MEELHSIPSQYVTSPNSKAAAVRRIEEVDGDLLTWTSRKCDFSPGRRRLPREEDENADKSFELREEGEE